MAAYVYLWKFNVTKDSFGHIALQLSDGTYISHWPSGDTRKVLSPTESEKKTYAGDIMKYHQGPDETLELPRRMLNEYDIIEWWDDCCFDYSLLFNNCADVVYQALKVGGILEHATPLTRARALFVRTPGDVFWHAKTMKHNYEQGDKVIGTLVSIGEDTVEALEKIGSIVEEVVEDVIPEVFEDTVEALEKIGSIVEDVIPEVFEAVDSTIEDVANELASIFESWI